MICWRSRTRTFVAHFDSGVIAGGKRPRLVNKDPDQRPAHLHQAIARESARWWSNNAPIAPLHLCLFKI